MPKPRIHADRAYYRGPNIDVTTLGEPQPKTPLFGVYCHIFNPDAVKFAKVLLAQQLGGEILAPNLAVIYSHREVLGSGANADRTSGVSAKSMRDRLEDSLRYVDATTTEAPFSRLLISDMPYENNKKRRAIVAEIAGKHTLNVARYGARMSDPRENEKLHLPNIKTAYVPLLTFEAYKEGLMRERLQEIGPQIASDMGVIATGKQMFVEQLPQ